MRGFWNCCFACGEPVQDQSNFKSKQELQGSRDIMGNANGDFKSEEVNELKDSTTLAANIILNHDFSGGLDMWHPNYCDAFVVSSESGYPHGISAKLTGRFAVVTNRKEHWHALEQDITNEVSAGTTYNICAWVAISGECQGVSDVLATLKLEWQDSSLSFLFIGKTSASIERLEKVEGRFSLPTMPRRVMFYLEGPSAGTDILIKSVAVSRLCDTFVEESKDTVVHGVHGTNIIHNHDFSGGLDMWQLNCCDAYAFVVDLESGYPERISAKLSGHPHCAVVTNRKKNWSGLEQDITERVSAGPTYTVCAWVAIKSAQKHVSDVLATLKLEWPDQSPSFLFIGKTSASIERWEKVHGTFSLPTMPRRIIFYLEGPSPGTAILINSVIVSCNVSSQSEFQDTGAFGDDSENVIQNPTFDDGLNNWSGRGCKIVLHDSMADGNIQPMSGKFFASTENRMQDWNGIEQEITSRVQRKLAYEISATVRLLGNSVNSADVEATLWVQAADLREQYLEIASTQATDKDWSHVRGKFLLSGSPSRVVIYLEGPPPGIDILLNNLVVKRTAKPPPASPPFIENAVFGVNIVTNSSLSNGTNGWFPLGDCTLSVRNGSPKFLPAMAQDSLGPHEPLSGRYILVTNRTETWMGPAQMITDKVKLYLTYQVSAWVRIRNVATRPQTLNVALGVDGQWVNGGQTEINDEKWHEIGGSFRIEKQPAKMMVYVQGADAGIDLMVAGLHIFPVDRHARFRHLKAQTEKIRKRDVTLKFTSSGSGTLSGTYVKIRQTQNSFPFGSCISRSIIESEDCVDFFCKNFNWAVFENELKWYWTEARQGYFNYKDADDMLDFCARHGIQLRGHCIFWEVEAAVQSWICSLSKNDLMAAIQNRLMGLLTRYKGKFKHYDVNNEMLHGSFFKDRLGEDIRASMFKIANQLDPSATLFVNDYNVEDGCDTLSSPDRYIQHVLDLQKQGAPVGGIGIQGHISSPVGQIICSALDKLGTLGLPIWFTEVDVSSNNEYIRADDLEVMLREAFAHPAVEGVVLWGFWELFMSRDNAHLVNAEGEINEAGQRFLSLKQEWLSKAHGHIDGQGQFKFRGFHGLYEVEVVGYSKEKVVKTFMVDPSEGPLLLSIDL